MSLHTLARSFDKKGIAVKCAFVREELKKHGNSSTYIGGHVPVENDRILIFDDVLSKGTSVRTTIENIKKEVSSAQILGILTIADRSEFKKYEEIQQYNRWSLFTTDDFRR